MNEKNLSETAEKAPRKNHPRVKPYYTHQSVTIYNEDLLSTQAVAPSSIDLIVTSPPYNVGISYNTHGDDATYEAYLAFMQQCLAKCYTLLKADGRLCLNIPLDKNKGGQRAIYADFMAIIQQIGYQYHSTIVWNEGNISKRTAWGSWMSASAPYVIAPVELIVVLYKQYWKKQAPVKKNDITKQEFMDWTNGLWTFNGESKKRIGHPAPFPIELPKRCIKLFSFVGDVVLDPFMGSGTTLLAANAWQRQGIGLDIDPTYCALSVERISKAFGVASGSSIKQAS